MTEYQLNCLLKMKERITSFKARIRPQDRRKPDTYDYNRDVAAFNNDLPELLKKHRGEWVAYSNGINIAGPLRTLESVMVVAHAGIGSIYDWEGWKNAIGTPQCFVARIVPNEKATPNDRIVLTLNRGRQPDFQTLEAIENVRRETKQMARGTVRVRE